MFSLTLYLVATRNKTLFDTIFGRRETTRKEQERKEKL